MALASGRFRVGTTALSHTGRSGLRDPAGFDVRAVHAFVSSTPMGPELSMRSGVVEGRLVMDLMALDTDMSRPALAEAIGYIRTALEQASEG